MRRAGTHAARAGQSVSRWWLVAVAATTHGGRAAAAAWVVFCTNDEDEGAPREGPRCLAQSSRSAATISSLQRTARPHCHLRVMTNDSEWHTLIIIIIIIIIFFLLFSMISSVIIVVVVVVVAIVVHHQR